MDMMGGRLHQRNGYDMKDTVKVGIILGVIAVAMHAIGWLIALFA